MTIEGDGLYATITDKGPVPEIEHNHNEEELYNFEMVAVSKKEKNSLKFDPYSNLNVTAIC